MIVVGRNLAKAGKNRLSSRGSSRYSLDRCSDSLSERDIGKIRKIIVEKEREIVERII